MPLFWEAAAILKLECIFVVIVTACDGVCHNRKFYQLHNTVTNNLNRLCYKAVSRQNWDLFIFSLTSHYRSSHQRCSVKKGVLRNFTNFTGRHLCQCLFFNKAVVLRPATLLKKRLFPRYFSVTFPKPLRAPFLQNTSGRLHLLKNTSKPLCNSKFGASTHCMWSNDKCHVW